MSWLILVDRPGDLSNAETPHKVMTTRDYLTRPKLFGDSKQNIINLSRSYVYQGTGYYSSLLAEARGHRIIPAVETMIELTRVSLYRHALPEFENTLNATIRSLAEPPADGFRLLISLGRPDDLRFERFSRLVFDWYRTPILEVRVSGGEWRAVKKIRPVPVVDLTPDERALFLDSLDRYTKRAWRQPKTRTPAKYSLAVLYNPKEEMPPSSQSSLKHMAKVAARLGVEVEPIQKRDLDRLAEFDALFIRETTAIDDHTYRFARRAVQEGMPVIDDPVSMIRCTNKVYLAELLSANNVPIPKTRVVQHARQAAELPGQLGWPIVLKIPDGSFSRGVFKVETLEQLIEQLGKLLEDSDLVLAQEFVKTTFDWRIGIIGGQPLFAVQYRMAKKHWQIIRHEPGKQPDEGGFRAFALDQVPPAVLDAAVRGARLIGNGFYGVDLKETPRGVFVIEINDNPNLDHGVEDTVGKDGVWETLLKWFVERLEA